METKGSAGETNAGDKDHRTLHLTSLEVWKHQAQQADYRPEGFDSDGFIHCTDDLDELLSVGNRYYQSDSREYVALTINCDLLTVPVRYEDPDHKFPHIYGALNVSAVERVQRVHRTARGFFVGFKL